MKNLIAEMRAVAQGEIPAPAHASQPSVESAEVCCVSHSPVDMLRVGIGLHAMADRVETRLTAN
jgi:hypothetical protein